jgi:hypothetical protein
MGCEIGVFPRTYLGLPLCLDPPNFFWGSLVDKLHSKLAGWKGSLLSQAGKLVVLKVVLQSSPLYALSVFKIPRKYANAIDKIQKNFLWTGMETKKRMALIAWDKVCKPVEKGGLGLRKVSEMNDFLMAKLLWRLFKDKGEWKEIWTNKYNWEKKSFNQFLSSNNMQGGSAIWKHAQNRKLDIRNGVKWKVGNGRTIQFWEDSWILDHPLLDD